MISIDIDSVASMVANKMLALGGGNVSRHLEEILSDDILASLRDCWCLQFLNNVEKIIRQIGDHRSVILTIGLPESPGIRPIKTIELECAPLPPTNAAIYFFHGQDFLIESCEEYRRSIIIPDEFDNISGIYRSWRSTAAEENDWDFSNDIYLWSTGEHERAHSPIN